MFDFGELFFKIKQRVYIHNQKQHDHRRQQSGERIFPVRHQRKKTINLSSYRTIKFAFLKAYIKDSFLLKSRRRVLIL